MKLQIIGASGTGKSTLAQYISQKEQIPWIDTDIYLWQDERFAHNRPLAKRIALYERVRERYTDFVVSGSTYSWLPTGFQDRDCLIFLSLDEELRLERLRTREIARNGTDNMTFDEEGLLTNDFLEWCQTYWTETDPKQAGTYVEQKEQMERSISPVMSLDSSRSVEELYQEIMLTLRS